MRIVWLLPFVNLTGGTKVVLEYANRLAALGHNVTIIYPGVLDRATSLTLPPHERYLRHLRYRIFVDLLHYHEARWATIHPQVRITRVPTLEGRYAMSADVTIATSFETAEYLEHYPVQSGKKFYFLQGYETWTGHPVRVDRTIRSHQLEKIVISTFLKQIVQQRGQKCHGPLLHGVDQEFFLSPQVKKSETEANKPRVLMLYHELAVKGTEDGIRAITLLRDQGYQFMLTMFGQFPLRPELKELVDAYHRNPAQRDLPALYQSADIFLWPSRQEGFGLPLLEAMAAGCAIVTTNTGAVSDLGKANKEFLVVQPESVVQLAEKLGLLVKDRTLRHRLGQAAARRAHDFSWDKATQQLIRMLSGTVKPR